MDDQQPTAAVRPTLNATASTRLSLIIPAYNEAAGIRQAVAEAETALAALTADYEILVVDDGSRDDTAALVEEAARLNPRVRLLRHEQNRGYGAALRTGFEAARFNRVAFTDADCQFHLDDLALLLPLTDTHPLAAGYRVGRQDPWPRRFLSWGYNTLVRTLLGTRVRDCDCALKVFRRDALAELLPESANFFVNTEMLTRARRLGYSVAEVGVRHRPRLRGASKVSLLAVPRTLRTLLPFWWSQVLFPQERPGRPRAAGGVSPVLSALHLGTLIVVAALLLFAHVGAPLQEPDEARYAEIPRQMLAEGHWIVPVLHGAPYPDKPPLLYWLVMASYRTCGVHDWAARLVSCGASFLVVLLTYFWGRRLLGARAAFAGALVLCLSVRFLYLGRLLTLDSLLCLWVVAALATAHLAVGGRVLRRSWWLVSALACGLGLLTKGPVALALVAPPLLAFLALDQRLARPGWRGWLVYLGVAAGVAAPWYAAMSVCQPDFATDFFWKHNVVRYLAPFDHAKPLWYHLPGLLLGMCPWTLLLPGLCRFLARHSHRTAVKRPAALGFYLLASGWCLVFYSLAGCKRDVYILPAIPPLALALGCYLDIVLPWERARDLLSGSARAAHRLAAGRLAFGATLSVLAVGIVGTLVGQRAGLLSTSGALLLVGAGVAGVVVVWWRGRRQGAVASWAVCGAVTFAVLFAGSQTLLPGYARKFSLRGSVRPQAPLCADPRVPVVCYPRRWDSVSFYLRRNDVRVFNRRQSAELWALLRQQPETLLVLKSRGARDLLRQLPPSLEFVPRGRRGNVTVGLVRQRLVVPDTLFVQSGAGSPTTPSQGARLEGQ